MTVAADMMTEAWDMIHTALGDAGLPVVRGHVPAVGGLVIGMYPGTPSHSWVTLGERLQVTVAVVCMAPLTHRLEDLAGLAAQASLVLALDGIGITDPEPVVVTPDAGSISISFQAQVHIV